MSVAVIIPNRNNEAYLDQCLGSIADDPAVAEILIFDDAFSALDFGTESRLRDSLGTALGTAVVIVVAERISAVAGADRILVLDEGRLVAEGTHQELLEHSATYREIAESQLALEHLP